MVSIVVPVYNTEKYLRRCLDALVHQTIPHSELEIIAVNDGSTDSSPEILKEYENKYPELVRVFNKTNGGQATARNLGIRMAKGEYIGFADSDDYVETTMFDKLWSLARMQDADLVECHYHSMLEIPSEDGSFPTYKEIGTRGTICAHDDVRELFLNPQVSPWNKLYKKSVLIDNDVFFPEGMIYEDTSFYIKSLPFITKHAYLDEKLVYYSVRQSSTMTKNLGAKVGDIFKVLDDITDFYHRKGIFTQYKDELEYFCVKIAFCSNFSRIGRVPNGYLRRELFTKTFGFVNKNFPDYRKNKYFAGKIGMYIKSVAKWNCGPYAYILSKIMIG
jgi:glycosyltransferase involved in cell wall biosynthesis